jgi:hypothetical protein
MYDAFPIYSDLKQVNALSTLLFNYNTPLRKSKKANRNWNSMGHIIFRSVPMMLIFRMKAYIWHKEKSRISMSCEEGSRFKRKRRKKYKFMSRHQTTRQNQCISLDNKYFNNVAKFPYLGVTVTNTNCIHEEIKCILNSGNACYHVVQNLFSSHLLSKNKH